MNISSSGDTAKWREQVELAKMEAQAFRAKFAEAGSRIAHLSHQLNKIEEANEQLVAQAKLARDVIWWAFPRFGEKTGFL